MHHKMAPNPLVDAGFKAASQASRSAFAELAFDENHSAIQKDIDDLLSACAECSPSMSSGKRKAGRPPTIASEEKLSKLRPALTIKQFHSLPQHEKKALRVKLNVIRRKARCEKEIRFAVRQRQPSSGSPSNRASAERGAGESELRLARSLAFKSRSDC
eukprot:Plantae.Rhodophyta-Hildenbrandia_rubra.ctg12721.p2 GENE.Plantae.Rhodophyta-Hildenbrandia_rubra.ctg12721~~Plantae.Rhodophyta-Hildenbrandia_rubra.ctg12721.p2  ORF type:complete len:159 (-),score=26.05 Plantae.Rhodophyta-Hildenbrandia_rubra.ctg12721:1992-2468(-)